MYEKYGRDAAFFVVYIGEAHPSDAWQLPSNIRDQVVFESPKDMTSRSELADICVVRLGIKLPAVVDRFDDVTANGRIVPARICPAALPRPSKIIWISPPSSPAMAGPDPL